MTMKSKSAILITRASRGLGREAARRLAAAGHQVWAAARDPGRGRAAAEEVRAHPLVLDVTDNESVRAAAATLADATGGVLDVLINNAGISGGPVSAAELTHTGCLEICCPRDGTSCSVPVRAALVMRELSWDGASVRRRVAGGLWRARAQLRS